MTTKTHYLEPAISEKNDNLPPHTPDRLYSSSGSTSFTPSPSSYKSGRLQVDEGVEIAGFDKIKSRKYTIDTSVKISRLDCIKGFLRPNTMKRKISTAVIVNPVEEPDYESQQKSPFILRVNVLSSEKEDETHITPKEAQCTLDTGNHHGNMVSQDFLFNVLRYPEAELCPLTAREMNGGTSASGHGVFPKGAAHLTWYHGKSPRTFHDMRFLVYDSKSFELVIGEKSIRKHNLISPPNLMVEGGRTQLNHNSEPDAIELTGKSKTLKSRLKTLNNDLEKAKKVNNKPKIETLEAQVGVLKQEIKVADLELDLYNAKERAGKEPTPQNDKDIKILQQQLEDAQADLPDFQKPQEALQIDKVSNTNTTGSSSRFGNMFKRSRKETDGPKEA